MKRFLLGFFTTLALVAGIFVTSSLPSNSTAANADGSCPTVCVTVPIQGTGDAGSTSPAGPGHGVGGGGGTGGSAPSYIYWEFKACTKDSPAGQAAYYDPNKALLCGVTVRQEDGRPKYFSCPARNGQTALGATLQEDVRPSVPHVTHYTGAYSCNYPSTPPVPTITQTVTCSWNYGGSFYYSINRSAIQGGGTFLENRARQAGDPGAPVLNGNSLSSCVTGNVNLTWAAKIKDYGYYTARTSHNEKTFYKWGYPSWTKNPNVFWTQSGTTTKGNNYYFTYSCPSALESFGENFNALPAQGARQFDISECPSTKWQCNIAGTLDIAGTHSPTELIRNGRNVSLTYPSVTVGGTGITKIQPMQYKTDVKAGSTPFKGTDPNASNQSFALKKVDGTTAEKFGQWQNDAANNRQKYLQFYWPSAAKGSFGVKASYQFTADFLVPRVDHVGGPVSMQYVTDQATCPGTPIDSNQGMVLRGLNGYNE